MTYNHISYPFHIKRGISIVRIHVLHYHLVLELDVTYRSLSWHLNIVHLSSLHARKVFTNIIFRFRDDIILISNKWLLKRIIVLFILAFLQW